MDTATIIAIAIVGGTIAIGIAISLGLDRIARWKLTKRFRGLEEVLDRDTVTISPGPEVRGSFHGREVRGYRRTELKGFTARGGVNGKTIFELSCSAPLQFTLFTLPGWPILAESLRLGSPKVPTGDRDLDRICGFASPDPDRFRAWLAGPGSKKAIYSVVSVMPPSNRQRFRLRIAGKLELNMPEYLYFKMNAASVKLLFQELDSFAQTLEQRRT